MSAPRSSPESPKAQLPDAKVWPRLIADPAHGPLPALLLVLTVFTGVIDAVSILGLGRVFVANMTGNIVFIAFAIASVPGFSLASSEAALAGFLVGAFAGGFIIDRYSLHRGRLLRNACGIEFVIVAVSFVITLTSHDDASLSSKVAVSALCAVAMGIQNTTVRKLAVPDLTTTVLTMTLTGIAADVRRSGFTVITRRVFAVLAMFVGGVAGAELFLHTRLAWALALGLFLLAVVTIAAEFLSRRPATWNTV